MVFESGQNLGQFVILPLLQVKEGTSGESSSLSSAIGGQVVEESWWYMNDCCLLG